MLSTMRSSWLLFVVLALVALSTAMSLEDALHLDGIEAYLLHNDVKRQITGTGGNSKPSSVAPTTDRPQSSNPPESTLPPSSEEPSSTPAPSSELPSSNSPSQNTPTPTPTPTPAPSSQKPGSKTPVVKTSVGLATSVRLFTTVQTIVSNGQTVAQTQTGAATEVLTTAVSLSTDPASLNGGNGNGNSGGLSSDNKKIIGGVVGGVGGAILLGGLAIVCWRIWGRKKRVGEDDDDLMAGTGSALGDKPHSPGSGNTPFQANLEQYHNPGGRPNAGTNF